MIVEWSHMALIGAFLVASQQLIWAWVAHVQPKKTTPLLVLQQRLSLVFLCLITASVVGLFYSFWICDFSVQYVAHHANTHLPWYYRLCALWGGHEGSLLLWVWLLTLWVSVVSYTQRHIDPLFQIVFSGVMALVQSALLAFMLMTSNPFLRYLPTAPLEGRDLNPLLQDPGMVSHPPILYMGYVGFSVIFGLAMAGLITGQWQLWVSRARRLAPLAWSFLTLGIVLGSWWAYRELGWGGIWFWDPVENASFMPWLLGTGLIHLLIATERRGHWHAGSLLLAILTFILSLLGTFLVRSGVVISVHAFAEDPSRGIWLLVQVALLSLLALWAFAKACERWSKAPRILPRGALLLSQSVLASLSMMIVLLGTLFPLVMQGFFGQSISVGAPYFNTVLWPVLSVAVLLMGFISIANWGVRWQDLSPKALRYPLWLTLISALLAAVFLHKLPLIVAVAMSAWLSATTFFAYRKRTLSLPASLAHFGLAICMLGVVFGHHLSSERYVTASVGSRFDFANEMWHWQSLRLVEGPNYQAQEAVLTHHPINQKTPSRTLVLQWRRYTTQEMALAKVAIERHWWGDWYVAMGQTTKDNVWTLRLYRRPFVYGVWLGGLLMMAGGLLAWRRR